MAVKPTDEFQYLSVLISIVLGLGLTQLLTRVGGLVQVRERVRTYWPVPVWTIVLIVIHVQSWWALFELRAYSPWTFPRFLIVLLTPGSLFLMAALLLPDPAEGAGAPIDLQGHYYRQARWFFGALCSLVVASALRPFVLEGQLPGAADLAFHAVFLAFSVAAFATGRRRFHEAAAVAMLALIVVYVGALFMRLR